MTKKVCIVLSFLLQAQLAFGQGGVELMDRRTFVFLMVDEFEFVDPSDAQDFEWDIDLSVGGDLHKAWIKTRGERSEEFDNSELQILYSKALLPFWDLQTGFRHDFEEGEDRDWAVVSIRGLAPYFFDVEAELFLAEGGQVSLRAKGEYELLITQRLILKPELEFVSFRNDEPGRLIGSGLSEVEFNVRLRYEIKREFAPYIGLGWHRLYGATWDFARAAGRERDDAVLSVGIRGWF